MIELLITIVLFLLLILAVIWLPFLKQHKPTHNVEQVNVRDETNVQLYHEHKAEIEQDYQQGSIDEENYQYLITELDKSLLQDISENKQAPEVFDSNANRISMLWPSVLTVFMLVFSFALYTKIGAYEKLTQVAPQINAQDAHQQLSPEQQVMVRIGQLKTLTDNEPENADAWYALGQALIGAGDFDGAVVAIDQVIRIEGEQADLFGAKAQAYYYKDNQQITPVVQTFIDKALAIDPYDASTNIMLGMDSFLNERYQQAITYWQNVVNNAHENVNIVALNEAINEAKKRLGMDEEDHSGHDHAHPETAQNGQAKPQHEKHSGPQLHLDVTLSDEIIALLSQGQDKTVFIYAAAAQGSRMPLAAVKVMASTLPATIVLSDANAMTPQANLSSAEQVNIYAVISKAGQPGIHSGDYTAEQLNVSVKHQGVITLAINHVVP